MNTPITNAHIILAERTACRLLRNVRNRDVSEVERLILRAALEGQSYEQIKTKHTKVYLRELGSSLMADLSKVAGKKITKDTLRNLLKTVQLPVEIVGDTFPEPEKFYGRADELNELSHDTASNRVVTIVGSPGIGKTALAATLARSALLSRWDLVIWKSICATGSASPDALLPDLLKLLKFSDQEASEDLTSEVLGYLAQFRCLIVLDAAEEFRSAAHQNFLRRVVDTPHNSCVVLVSEEPFEYLERWQRSRLPIKTLYLGELKLEASLQILADKFESAFDQSAATQLVQNYGGNPSLLHLISNTTCDLFGGSIQQLLKHVTTFYTDGIEEMLKPQFSRFGDLEIQVMNQLALSGIPLSFADLLARLKSEGFSSGDLLQTLDYLDRRSLITTVEGEVPKYSVNSVIRKYVLFQIEVKANSVESAA